MNYEQTLLERAQELMAEKTEIVIGSYMGSDNVRQFDLGFRPKAVVVSHDGFTEVAYVAVDGVPTNKYGEVRVTDAGFQAYQSSGTGPNVSGWKYSYFALA